MPKAARSRRFLVALSCEHASQHVPAAFELLADRTLLDSHWAFDKGAKELTLILSRHFQTEASFGKISRLLVDLNRSRSHPHLYSKAANPQQRQALFKDYYLPFRNQVRSHLQSIRKLHPNTAVLHLSIHSFTRSYKGQHRQTDIGILYDNDRPYEAQIASMLQSQLRQATDYRIHRNRPYWGKTDGHTAALRKIYSPELYWGIELEVCNDLLIGKQIQIIAKTVYESVQSIATSLNRNSD